MTKLAEVIKTLNIPSVQVYRYIKSDKMLAHITTNDNIKFVDDTGIEILKEKFCNNIVVKNADIVATNNNELQQQKIEMLEREIAIQKDYIDTLNKLLQQEKLEKADLRKLIENSQVLLQNEQERKLLPEPEKKKKWLIW
jgi:uncharacterized coiled-coil protein SlyX